MKINKFSFLGNYNFLLSLILIGVVIVIFFNHFVYDPAAKPSAVVLELNNMQERTLDTLSSMTELLITLSTAIFGVIGYFTIEKSSSLNNLPKSSKLSAITSLAFATLSIDFGYVYMEKWVELLANDMFLPYDPIVSRPRMLQFASFVLSLCFLGRFLILQLKNES